MKELDRPPLSRPALGWSIVGFIDGMSDGMIIGSLAKAKRSRATASLSGGGGDCW
jgi:hypothetical protein